MSTQSESMHELKRVRLHNKHMDIIEQIITVGGEWQPTPALSMQLKHTTSANGNA